jgi:hypothetical protein
MTRASWTFTNLSIVLENMKRKKEIKESIHNFERRYDCETEDRERVSARHTKLKIEIRISTRRRRRKRNFTTSRRRETVVRDHYCTILSIAGPHETGNRKNNFNNNEANS